MIRSFRAFLAVLMIGLLTVPIIATASWQTKEVGWHVTYTNGLTQLVAQRDTALTVLNGAATLDTSQVFTLDEADQPQRGVQAAVVVNGSLNGAAANDTTVAGFLVVQPDTAAAPGITNGTFTIMLEGKVGGFGAAQATNARGWSRIDSTVTTLGAVADESMGIPIRTIGKYGTPFAFPALRIRSIGGTGIMGSVRLFLRYWKNDGNNSRLSR